MHRSSIGTGGLGCGRVQKRSAVGGRRAVRAAAAVAALVAGAHLAAAAPATWDGDGPGGVPGDNVTWGNANNWTTGGTPDTAPTDTPPGDDLTFGGGTAGATIDLGANRFSNLLIFNRDYALGTAGGTFTLTNATGGIAVTAGTTATINAPLVGATGLTKTDAGTLILTGANTFTGAVNINGGTLSFGGTSSTRTGAIPPGDVANKLGAVTNAVNLNGGTLRYTAALRFPFDADTNNQHTFTIGAAGGTFDVAAAGGQFEIRNVANSLTSPLGAVLTKTGPGTLRVSSANANYLGTTVINQGVLEASVNAFGATTVTINGGNFTANGNTTNPFVLNGGAISPVNGDRTLPAAATGNLTATGGSIFLNDWYGDTARSITLQGIISGTGPLTINVSRTTAARTGVAILTGANTYSGQTNVLSNVLRAASGTGLPNASNLNLNGGVFETTAATFNRALGTGAGQVQLPGGASGFSSQVAAATVNLGGAGAQVQWGVGSFNPSALVLNAASANNPLTFANPIDLNGATRTVTVNAPLGNNIATISGVVSDSVGANGLTKNGQGVLALTGANTYSGATTVSAGVIRGVSGTGLPNTSNLTLNGGAFESGVNFTRALGTAAGEVQLPGGTSGFSAFGAPISVNLGGAGAPVQWGVGAFTPGALLLNHGSANNTLNFVNPLDLNGATRTVTVNGNVATLGGAVTNSTGTAGLTKTGGGVLVLGSTGNTYTGATTVAGGALRAVDGSTLPASNLTLNGGAFEGSVNVTRPLGTGDNQVQLPGGASGFSAFGAPIAVNLGGAAAPIQWGGATFNPSALLLNASTANNTLDFQNPIDVNGAARTVQVNANTATLSGVVSNSSATAAGLTKTGGGTLVLSAANTYNGTTTISAGSLSVSNENQLGAPTAPLSINGGTLRVTGTAMNNLAAHPITMANVVGFDIADAANNFTVAPAAVLNTGVFSKFGPGTLTLNLPAGTNEVDQLHMFGGTLDLGSGNLLVNNAGADTIQGRGNSIINASGGGTITISMAGTTGVNFGDNDAENNVTLTINAKITSAAGVPQGFEYCCNNGGTIVLNNPANDFVGNVFLNNSGTISVPGIGPSGIASPLGRGTMIQFDENTNAGPRLLYTGPGEDTNRVLNLLTNAILEQAGTGRLRFTAAATGTNTKTLTLQGNTSGLGELSGGIPAGTSILKTGTGTWVLSGPNASAGTTTINGGTLLANTPAPGSATGTGAVTVNANGILGGTGNVGGSVTVNLGGTVSPGTSPGTLSAAGPVTFGTGGTGAAPTFLAELLAAVNPTTAGTDNDLLAITGALTLTNPDRLSLVALNDITEPATYTIATFASMTGVFDTVLVNGEASQSGDPAAPNYVTVAYNPTNIQVTVDNLAAIPEPATAGLLGLGAVGLLARRRRRHQAR